MKSTDCKSKCKSAAKMRNLKNAKVRLKCTELPGVSSVSMITASRALLSSAMTAAVGASVLDGTDDGVEPLESPATIADSSVVAMTGSASPAGTTAMNQMTRKLRLPHQSPLRIVRC